MIESFFIAIAICLDAFALGITYGLKQIKLSWVAIALISCISTTTFAFSVTFGQILRVFISNEMATLLSCLLLIGFGLLVILQSIFKHLASKASLNRPLFHFNIPKLGLIVHIALDVTQADLDVSGDISLKEALYIGFALSIDSLGTGFGYGVSDVNFLLLVVSVLFFSLTSISLGASIGHQLKPTKDGFKASLLPGVLLIVVGILKGIG